MSPCPGDVDEPLGRLAKRLDVAAVVAVDGDPAPERDVADDLVPGHRPAALRQPHDDVADALDLDPEVRRLLGAALALVAPLEHPGQPASVSSPATASPAFSRCMTLFRTVFAEILPWPRAM